MTIKAKIITTVSAVVVIGLAVFCYFHFFFVYSTGVNAGDLNYFQREGLIFKTYEGKIIQTGFNSNATKTSSTQLRSNELKFSVTDKDVAERLMRCSGKNVELRWNRYYAPLPWRGNSRYVVYEILSERPSQEMNTLPPVDVE